MKRIEMACKCLTSLRRHHRGKPAQNFFFYKNSVFKLTSYEFRVPSSLNYLKEATIMWCRNTLLFLANDRATQLNFKERGWVFPLYLTNGRECVISFNYYEIENDIPMNFYEYIFIIRMIVGLHRVWCCQRFQK